jgi:predicted alpha/beta superfamily hydrolase
MRIAARIARDAGIALVIAGLAGTSGVAAVPAPARAPVPVTVPRSAEFRWHSAVTRRDYLVRVARPPLPPGPSGYPVVWVLDGDQFFATAADQIATRSFADLRSALVVGIAYPTRDPGQVAHLRMKDLTPDCPTPEQFAFFLRNGFTLDETGGGEAFLEMLVGELRPWLAKRYPVDPQDQTLFGHSFGGLLALHALFTRPDSFSTFVAASPAIHWAARAVLAREPRLAAALAAGHAHPRVLITVGARESDPDAIPTPGIPHDEVVRLVAESRMVANASELAVRLRDLPGPAGYAVEFAEFAGENHVSVQAPSLTRGLTFALRRP